MKALTLTQPWATLVAVGAKIVETRSWRTSYRGLLAIHAAQGFPKGAMKLANWDVRFSQALLGGGLYGAHDLPRGEVIAICRLRNCIPTEEAVQHISDQEKAFGDYTPGRWAWLLSDVQRLIHPVPTRGALGLWEWDPGPDWERALGVDGR